MPYQSNVTGTIADLMGRHAQIESERLRLTSDAQARALEIGGQAWGNAANQIGQTVRGTLGDVLQQRREAPIRAQEAEARQLQIDAGKQQVADRTSLDTAFSQGLDREGILSRLPGHLRPTVQKQFQEADAAALTVREKREAVAVAERDYLGSLAAGVKAHGYDAQAAMIAFQHAAEQGYDVRPYVEEVAKDPARLQSMVDRLIAQSPKQVELIRAGSQQEETGRHNLATEAAAKVTAATAGERWASEQARLAAGQRETVRHNQAMEARPVAGAANAASTLDEDGLDLAATAYRLTKSLPARDAKQNGAVISRAAAQAKQLGNSPVATIQKQAAYQADAKALAKMQGMASSAEAFETKANAQAGLVMDLSAKVGRTQFPVINEVLLSGKEYLGGDQNTHLFSNALLTFTTEYAKLMEGSTGSAAGSSEGARRDAAKLISTALNDGTIQKTIAQMQWEMTQTMRGYDVAISHISDRMGGGTPIAPPAAPTATIRARDAQGVLHEAPRGTALPAGWRLEP